MTPPHEHGKVLGHFSYGTEAHVRMAIDAALGAKAWSSLGWEQRAAVFLKAADLVAGPPGQNQRSHHAFPGQTVSS